MLERLTAWWLALETREEVLPPTRESALAPVVGGTHGYWILRGRLTADGYLHESTGRMDKC